ncbi:hypothetical protein ACRS3X_07930 [Ectopseudomonas hydrolytica]|uniref:hypothetical protein n=1 Tax=Ectopseudomonas hydrolytica TaxID=2493633 RepID=UPI003EDEC779
MTAGLLGAGTEADPWLISNANNLNAVVRDVSSSGFYRLTSDISSGLALAGLSTANAATYAAKVIDCDGFEISWNMNLSVVGFAGIHWRNLTLRCSLGGTGTRYLFYNCSATNVAVYFTLLNSGDLWVFASSAVVPFIIPREVRRVLLFDRATPSLALNSLNLNSSSPVTPVQCFLHRTNVNVVAGFTSRSVPLTLADLDGLTSNAFSDAGWWETGNQLMPLQAETVSLALQTIADGNAKSRRLWVESERTTRYLGESDAAGQAALVARVRKWASFTVLASEDYGADELRATRLIAAGYFYLPPADNGFVYQAGSAGRITSLVGVVFNDQPVTIDGIVFTPRPAYRAVMSARRSVQRNGSSQTFILDNSSGGGGPVIDGDPAYLDGVVEEVHPTFGTVRPLANSEVAVFERRGDAYVAMGRALSNAVGEFRVETQVYGGGDVFAFAADFPGVIWSPGVELNLGNRLRPTTNNGYVYEIVEAGVSGATEPAWWADQGDGTEGYIGTARAKARPYYQPVGHGPLQMTLVDP